MGSVARGNHVEGEKNIKPGKATGCEFPAALYCATGSPGTAGITEDRRKRASEPSSRSRSGLEDCTGVSSI
jgi:hypothetical protein